MKKFRLALVILSVLGFVGLWYSKAGTSHPGILEGRWESAQQHFLPDSIKEEIADKKFVIFSYGHHGVVWSLIYQNCDSYQILSGTTRQIKPNRNEKIDTGVIIKRNKALLEWALDTLPILSEKMEPQYRDAYSPFYSCLDIYKPDKGVVFESNAAIGFSGPDSIDFNKKFDKMCYLMRWLSSSDIRKYLPDTPIYNPQ